MKQCAAMVLGIAVALLWTGSIRAQDAKKVETGKTLFTSKQCTMCHQIAGKGNKMNVLDGVASRISAADMRKWLTNPAEMEAKLTKKPPLKMSSKKAALKDSEVDDLVAYLQTLK
jgi:cytochrome c2